MKCCVLLRALLYYLHYSCLEISHMDTKTIVLLTAYWENTCELRLETSNMTAVQTESCRVHSNRSNDGKWSFIFSCCIHSVLKSLTVLKEVRRGFESQNICLSRPTCGVTTPLPIILPSLCNKVRL